MDIVTHDQVTTRAGEPVQIIFTVTDEAGNAVSLIGALATWKIARRTGDAALLTKTESSGITLSTNTATVNFNTTDVLSGGVQMYGDLHDELCITKGGDKLYVAEGIITIGRVIT